MQHENKITVIAHKMILPKILFLVQLSRNATEDLHIRP